MKPVPKKRIVVTGATGFLGSNLVAALAAQDGPLALVASNKVDSLSRKHTTEWMPGDVRDPSLWWRVAQWKPDVIFHFAAAEHAFGRQWDTWADLETNQGATLRMLEALAKNRLAPRIVFASTAHLNAGTKDKPARASDPLNPKNLFAIHKMASEEYLKFYSQTAGIPAVALRFSNLYGPSPLRANYARPFINKMLLKGAQTGSITLFSNRESKRDCLYVDDAVSALTRAAEVTLAGNFQAMLVGSGATRSFAEIGRCIGEVLGKGGHPATVREDSSVALEPSAFREDWLDISATRQLLAWEPRVTLEQGVAALWKAITEGEEKNFHLGISGPAIAGS